MARLVVNLLDFLYPVEFLVRRRRKQLKTD